MTQKIKLISDPAEQQKSAAPDRPSDAAAVPAPSASAELEAAAAVPAAVVAGGNAHGAESGQQRRPQVQHRRPGQTRASRSGSLLQPEATAAAAAPPDQSRTPARTPRAPRPGESSRGAPPSSPEPSSSGNKFFTPFIYCLFKNCK